MITKTSKEIYCKFVIEGTHSWSDCPHEDVSYLRYEHRHRFFFKVSIEVTHSNRDIEFIRFMHGIKDQMVAEFYDESKSLCTFGYNSCEMLAESVINKVQNRYGLNFAIVVDVSEDDECGAIVKSSPATLQYC